MGMDTELAHMPGYILSLYWSFESERTSVLYASMNSMAMVKGISDSVYVISHRKKSTMLAQKEMQGIKY